MNRRIKRAAAMGRRIYNAYVARDKASWDHFDSLIEARKRIIGYILVNTGDTQMWGYSWGLWETHGFEVFCPEMPPVFGAFVNHAIAQIKDRRLTEDPNMIPRNPEEKRAICLLTKSQGHELPVNVHLLRGDDRGRAMSQMNVFKRNTNRKQRQGVKIFMITPA